MGESPPSLPAAASLEPTAIGSGRMDYVVATSTQEQKMTLFVLFLELVSEELNHFGLIAGLFRQIRGHTG